MEKVEKGLVVQREGLREKIKKSGRSERKGSGVKG